MDAKLLAVLRRWYTARNTWVNTFTTGTTPAVAKEYAAAASALAAVLKEMREQGLI